MLASSLVEARGDRRVRHGRSIHGGHGWKSPASVEEDGTLVLARYWFYFRYILERYSNWQELQCCSLPGGDYHIHNSVVFVS